MIGEGGVAVLKHEATFLLARLVAPVDAHLVAVWREQTSHSLSLQAHVEHVVLAQSVSHAEGLARGSHSSHGYRVLGNVGWSEVEVAGDDVCFLCLEHELEALVFAVEERNVLLVGRTIFHLEVVTHIPLDYSFLYSATLGVESKRHFLVFERYSLSLSLQSRVEEGGRVCLDFCFCISLALISGSLACFFHLGMLSLGDGVLNECRSLFFG